MAPYRVAREHPLLLAFAAGATASASAVTAAIVKAVAISLRFMIISFAFINFLQSWKEIIPTPFSLRRYRRQQTSKAATILCIL